MSVVLPTSEVLTGATPLDVARRWLEYFDAGDTTSLKTLYTRTSTLHVESGKIVGPDAIVEHLQHVRELGCVAPEYATEVESPIARVVWTRQSDARCLHANMRVDNGAITEQWLAERFIG